MSGSVPTRRKTIGTQKAVDGSRSIAGFSKLDGIRFHILNFSHSRFRKIFRIVVDRFERVTGKEKTELVIDLSVERTSSENQSSITVPITFSFQRPTFGLEH